MRLVIFYHTRIHERNWEQGGTRARESLAYGVDRIGGRGGVVRSESLGCPQYEYIARHQRG